MYALQFVADAVQHSSFVRRAAYDDIGWKMDHPVLLRIKKRFDPVPIRVRARVSCSSMACYSIPKHFKKSTVKILELQFSICFFGWGGGERFDGSGIKAYLDRVLSCWWSV